MNFNEWLRMHGLDPAALSDERRAALEVAYELQRPYPNEHSARLRNPGDFNPDTYRRTKGGTIYGKTKVPATIAIIWAKLKGKDKPSDPPLPQALRFPVKNWTVPEAKAWLKKNNVKHILFEPAKKSGERTADELPRIFGQELQRCELTTRTYRVNLKTLDEENRSVEAVIATEAQVTVLDWSRFRIIDEVLLMKGCRLPAGHQVPMLDSHNRSTVQRQLGSTRELRTEGDKLVGRNFFSNSAVSEHPWTLTREGHLRDNSIGYHVSNGVIIERGKDGTVEGRHFKASAERDLRIATAWQVKENSVCAIGADVFAKNREEQTTFIRKGLIMEFTEWLKARGLDSGELNEEQLDALRKDFDKEQAAAQASAQNARTAQEAAADKAGDDGSHQAADPEPTPDQIARQAIDTERQRVNDIRSLSGDDVPADVIERCISEGNALDEARAMVLAAIRNNRPKVTGPAIIVHTGEMSRQVIEAAMLMRAGSEDIVLADKAGGERLAEQAERHRDISLYDVCRRALMLDGVEIPPGRDEAIRAAFSTPSLPVILGNVANKSLLKGYNTVPATWRKWCSTGSVSDFKEVTGARLTDTGALEEVGNAGEVHYGSAEEETEKYSVATYAKNFGVTRHNIINDDLRAVTNIPQGMGAKAGRKPGDLVYAHLLLNGNMGDGVNLFHATHKNLNTGAALAKDKLAAGITAFAKQTDKDGQPINVEPRFLTVPWDLRFDASELVKSTTIVIAGSTDTVKPAHNAISDLDLQVVSEARMSNAAYTGNSTTTWYLMGDPNLVDTIIVVFLNGRQQPTIERFPAGPDVMGIIFRVFLDVGCKSLDWRGMQKNTAA